MLLWLVRLDAVKPLACRYWNVFMIPSSVEFWSTMSQLPTTICQIIENACLWSVKNQRTPANSVSNSSLYQGTVRFNILLGSNEDNPTQDEIDEACKGANVCILLVIANSDLRIHSILTRRL